MPIYNLTFSHIVNGERVEYKVDGKPVTLQVAADGKTSAIYHQDTVNFCKEHGTTVRKVDP